VSDQKVVKLEGCINQDQIRIASTVRRHAKSLYKHRHIVMSIAISLFKNDS